MSIERKTSPMAKLAQINVTPMIDVLLVLLIIFMLVTPLAHRSLDAALPKPPAGPPPGPDPQVLVLEIASAGYALNRAPVASLEDLEQRLRSLMETRDDKTLFVRAGGEVGYSRVVDALDTAKGAGVERIGMLESGVGGE